MKRLEWLARFDELTEWQAQISARYDRVDTTGQGSYPDEEQADINEQWAQLARAAMPLIWRYVRPVETVELP